MLLSEEELILYQQQPYFSLRDGFATLISRNMCLSRKYLLI